MKHFIIMCDIVESSQLDPISTIDHFKRCTNYINDKYSLLSPLTITLGDEFQGVVRNLVDSVNIIIDLEEYIIECNFNIKLRYVIYYGNIDTAINPKIAYEMLGDGLTKARKTINELKSTSARFNLIIDDNNKKSIINNCFIIYQSIIDNWNIRRDHSLISNLIKYNDYKVVAKKMNKERSLIWKREKNLNLIAYKAIKDILKNISKQ